METIDRRWELAATGASRPPLGRPLPWWRQALIALRPPVWPAVVAAMMMIGLLLAFQTVVAQGVAQGQLRRSATAAQADGHWRCRLIQAADERDHCLSQVGGA